MRILLFLCFLLTGVGCKTDTNSTTTAPDRTIYSVYSTETNEPHYLIAMLPAEQVTATVRGFRNYEPLNDSQKRISSFKLDESDSHSFVVIREFENLAAAKAFGDDMQKDATGEKEFIPLSMTNYRIVLQEKDLKRYREYYQQFL